MASQARKDGLGNPDPVMKMPETESEPLHSIGPRGLKGFNSLSKLSLEFQLAAVTIPSFLLIVFLAFAFLSGQYRDYKQLSRVRDLVVLASKFSAAGVELQIETNSKMWFLLFIELNGDRAKYGAYLDEFSHAAGKTDSLIADAHAIWSKIDKKDLDQATIGRIEGGFDQAERLKVWRRVIVSCGTYLPPLIANDEYYKWRLRDLQDDDPRRVKAQALWDYLKEKSYTELSSYFCTMPAFIARSAADGQLTRRVIFQAELMKYQILAEREDALIHFFIEPGSRPRGLTEYDFSWLRSLWDREQSVYEDVWALATADERRLIEQSFSERAYPRLAEARKWLLANWSHNDIHQLFSNELYEEVSSSRGREQIAYDAIDTLREQLISDTTRRMEQRTREFVALFAVITGFAVFFCGTCFVFSLNISRTVRLRQRAEAEQFELETQLRLAQKLESVGRLAAGVAHEINTPTQFISDNIHFLTDAFAKLNALISRYRGLRLLAAPLPECAEAAKAAAEAESEAELDYISEEIPRCLQQSVDGLARVSRIVCSLKEFAHPNSPELVPADINRSIETSLTVSRHEWKYVSEMVTDLDPDLPLVPCVVDEFNQVILNLIVNAAHAIGEALKVRGGDRGKITVRTRKEGKWAVIEVEDTGTGIPEEIRERIFEPFFTTKPVGKGTGQGLSIVHSVIVKHHNGSVDLKTEPGRGTSFIVRLPLAAPTKACVEKLEPIMSP